MTKQFFLVLASALFIVWPKALASPSSGEERQPYESHTREEHGIKADTHHAPEAKKWPVINPCLIPGEKAMGEQCGKRIKPPYR